MKIWASATSRVIVGRLLYNLNLGFARGFQICFEIIAWAWCRSLLSVDPRNSNGRSIENVDRAKKL